MTREQEKEIIARVTSGDTEAFSALVEENQTRVYNIALKMLGNPEDAMDISQEAFLKAFRALELFRAESSFSSWMFRLTTNLCIDHIRRRKKEKLISLSDTEAETERELEIPDLRYSPETELERAELRRAVDGALKQLSTEHRQALVLREVGGLSYAEIAEELDIELGTVKSRISRARAEMRRQLVIDGNFFDSSASEKTEGGDMRG